LQKLDPGIAVKHLSPESSGWAAGTHLLPASLPLSSGFDNPAAYTTPPQPLRSRRRAKALGLTNAIESGCVPDNLSATDRSMSVRFNEVRVYDHNFNDRFC